MKGSFPNVRLREGSTGFRRVSDPPLPVTDVKACRAAWYATARAARATSVDFAQQESPQNFHRATLSNKDGIHVALFHPHYPLIAFADARHHPLTADFREPPAWATTLTDSGFSLLDLAFLRVPLAAADTSALSEPEREQVRYWRPDTVGELLFHSWD